MGLSWPARLPGATTACDFLTPSAWTFEPVDSVTFPALSIARAAGIAGGLVPAAFNAANEQAVAAFTSGALTFPGIFEVLDRIVDEADHLRAEPSGVQDVLDAEAWARTRADEMIERTVGARR